MCWFLLSYSFLNGVFLQVLDKVSCHFSHFSVWILGSFSCKEIITTSMLFVFIKIFEFEPEEAHLFAQGNLLESIRSYFPHCFRYKHFRRN